MPLIYLPLIMYTGWMEFLFNPLRPCTDRPASGAEVATAADLRAPL